MKKSELTTPAIILDLDTFDRNLTSAQALADKHQKKLWPMIKTHKSTEIAHRQRRIGADGFVCGTLDECETLSRAGFGNIMYAYPVAAGPSVRRITELSRKGDFYFRLDCQDQVKELNEAAGAAGIKLNYTVIIDCGLHRFGLTPELAPAFVRDLQALPHLVFQGISTHPGQTYGGAGAATVEAAADDEQRVMGEAQKRLTEAGFPCRMVTSGSTPTYTRTVGAPHLTHLHPGNYVFKDLIQVSLEAATTDDCALSVLATVISRPAADRVIIDAGGKCLGIDQGAHGAGTIRGYGYIKGFPELEVYGLSEEVGKIHVPPTSPLQVGDRVEIIPNHSCSTANLTSYYIGCRGEEVVETITVDIRSNSTTCGA